MVCLASLAANAQKLPVWQDPNVNQQNRLARHAHFFAFESIEKATNHNLQDPSRWRACGDSIL